MSVAVTLDDKYVLESGRVYLTGTQALVRLPMMQRQRDQAAGLNTAGYISGYRGSPLGGFDQALWQAKRFIKKSHIEFQPGTNEDLAATALWGTQQVHLYPGARYDGVFGMWYGKGPGVDRSGDVFKHANYAGTSRHGLRLYGRDSRDLAHGAAGVCPGYRHHPGSKPLSRLEGFPHGNRRLPAPQPVTAMLKLASRNIFRQKVRTGMTLAAIMFGVVGLILSGGFIQDIFIQLGEALIHSQSGHLQVVKKGYFTYGSRSPEKYLVAEPEALRKKIAGIPGIDDVLVRVNFSGLLNNGRTDWPIIAEGIEPDKEAKLGSFMQIVQGRQLTDKDRFGITIGHGAAKTLNLSPGDRITLLMNTPEGALNTMDFEVVGIFQSFSKDFDGRAVRIPLGAAHELLGTSGINSFVVSLKNTPDTDNVAERLRHLLPAEEFDIRTWVQLNDFYEKTIALYEQQFGFLQFIILAMVLLSVANSVNMSIFERVGEFGTMMALGNRRRDVFQLILTESALLGLIGSGIGALLGIVLALLVSHVGIPMPPPPNANLGYMAAIQVVPGEILRALAIGMLATLSASILPGLRVTRTTVVDALRQNF